MKQYLELMRYVFDHGVSKDDRTGTGTRSVFGYQMRFDLAQGFPLLTTKKLHLRSIIYELLWFLRGDNNTRYLRDHGVSIWDEWACDDGDLGPLYGRQWRSWPLPEGGTCDQLGSVIQQLKRNPDSRRLLVSAWNVADLPNEALSPQDNVRNGKMALAPCHAFFQFYVADGRLSCQLYQRSADIFLGLPFNIAAYALLTTMVAQVCSLQVGDFIHVLGDAHLYSSHLQQVEIQLSRQPRDLPQIELDPKIKNLFAFGGDDFVLTDYQPYPHIKAPVAI